MTRCAISEGGVAKPARKRNRASATVFVTGVGISDKFGQVMSLALEFGRVLGELDRAGALVFEDCAREHEPFDVEERLLDLVRARPSASVW